MSTVAERTAALKALHKRLLKDHPPAERWVLEPLPAVVRGIMGEDVPDEQVDAAVDAIDAEFVDLNELRVATELELAELVGSKYPDIVARSVSLRQVLNDVVEREGTLRLDRLKTLADPADVKTRLSEMNGLPPYALAFAMLHAFDHPSMPVDATTLAALVEAGAVDDGTSKADAAAFVEQKMKPADVYDFFTALRASAFADA